LSARSPLQRRRIRRALMPMSVVVLASAFGIFLFAGPARAQTPSTSASSGSSSDSSSSTVSPRQEEKNKKKRIQKKMVEKKKDKKNKK